MTLIRHAYRGSTLPDSLREPYASRHDYAPSGWRCGWWLCRDAWVACWKFVFLITTVIVLALAGLHYHYDGRAANVDYATIGDLPERIELFDAEGTLIGSIPWGTTRRSLNSIEELPQHFIDALLWMEDRRFYAHEGVSWLAVANAVARDAKTRSLRYGGSTITVQLAKLTQGIPKHERVWAKFDRKFAEWCIAQRIEEKFSKEQILLHYVNYVDFGGGFHGIHAASQGWFGKVPRNLTVLESATLVSILRGPTLYSPIQNPTNCKARRDLILRELVKAGKLNADEAQRLCSQPLVTKHREWGLAQSGSEEIRLATRELWASGIPLAVLQKGGLKVTLTIDPAWDARCMALTEAHLNQIDPRIAGRPLQAAALVIESRTGEVKALQTGRGLPGDHYDRVFHSDALRQAGSIAKPFVYQLAFARGTRPMELMRNDEIGAGELWPRVNWSPRNAGHRGDVISCQDGLIFSQNRLTVRLGARISLPAYGALLEKLGVCDADTIMAAPASLIGSFEARLADLVRAFTIFPLEGREASMPHIVRAVHSPEGKLLFAPSVVGKAVADQSGCRIAAGCLRKVFTQGTAKSAVRQVSARAIGKTGSTNGPKDCWFIGADEIYTCGVWVGCDKPTVMAGGSGAKFALPLWVQIMHESPANRR